MRSRVWEIKQQQKREFQNADSGQISYTSELIEKECLLQPRSVKKAFCVQSLVRTWNNGIQMDCLNMVEPVKTANRTNMYMMFTGVDCPLEYFQIYVEEIILFRLFVHEPTISKVNFRVHNGFSFSKR